MVRLRVSQLVAQGAEGVALELERGGEVRRWTNAERDPELARPPPFWQARVLHFRAIPAEGRMTCRH